MVILRSNFSFHEAIRPKGEIVKSTSILLGALQLVDKATIACSFSFITKITRLHNPSDRGRRSCLEETEDVETLVVNIDVQHTLDGPQTRGGYRHLQGVLLHSAHELSHSDIIDSCFQL